MSTLQIDLDAETESRLKQLSDRDGNDIGEIASRLLAKAARSVRPAQEVAEAKLLERINQGWSGERWHAYRALVAKRRAETLTEDEYAELVRLTNDREVSNARRLSHLAELAELRRTSLESVMDSLGIRPPGYE